MSLDTSFPNLDPLALEIGQAYVVSRQTPLMPSYNPIDPIAAIKQMKQIPKDGGFKVLEISKERSNPWYKVIAFDQSAKEIGTGWINGTALVGQELKAQTTEQANVRDQPKDLLGEWGARHDIKRGIIKRIADVDVVLGYKCSRVYVPKNASNIVESNMPLTFGVFYPVGYRKSNDVPFVDPTAGFIPVNGKAEQITYESSDHSIAQIHEDGSVGFRSGGKVKITVTVAGESIAIALNVVELPLKASRIPDKATSAKDVVATLGFPDIKTKHYVSWPESKEIDGIYYSPSVDGGIALEHWEYNAYPGAVIAIVGTSGWVWCVSTKSGTFCTADPLQVAEVNKVDSSSLEKMMEPLTRYERQYLVKRYENRGEIPTLNLDEPTKLQTDDIGKPISTSDSFAVDHVISATKMVIGGDWFLLEGMNTVGLSDGKSSIKLDNTIVIVADAKKTIKELNDLTVPHLVIINHQMVDEVFEIILRDHDRLFKDVTTVLATKKWDSLKLELTNGLTDELRGKLKEFVSEYEGTKEAQLASDEIKAYGKLNLAKQYLDKNNQRSAKRILNELMESFPRTSAAKDARILFKELE